MFERLSLRIVAGSLLWSVAIVLLSISLHGRLLGPPQGELDVAHMRSFIASASLGGFFGALFGAATNVYRHPMWINAGAALGFILALASSRSIAQVVLLPNLDPWANGLAILYSIGSGGAILGRLFTPWLKKAVPLGAKLESRARNQDPNR